MCLPERSWHHVFTTVKLALCSRFGSFTTPDESFYLRRLQCSSALLFRLWLQSAGLTVVKDAPQWDLAWSRTRLADAVLINSLVFEHLMIGWLTADRRKHNRISHLTISHLCLYRAEKTEVLSEDLLQVSCDACDLILMVTAPWKGLEESMCESWLKPHQ